MLAINPWSSGSATSTLNRWLISPVPELLLFKDTISFCSLHSNSMTTCLSQSSQCCDYGIREFQMRVSTSLGSSPSRPRVTWRVFEGYSPTPLIELECDCIENEFQREMREVLWNSWWREPDMEGYGKQVQGGVGCGRRQRMFQRDE